MFFLTEENGSRYLKEHSLPVPLYDVGESVQYKLTTTSKIDTGYIEAYDVSVFSYTDKDGDLAVDAVINYHMASGEVVPEEMVICALLDG